MRIWLKIVSDNCVLRDTVIEDYSSETRTHKIKKAVEEACRAFDLSLPIWYRKNISEFKRHSRCRFTKDNFIDELCFDYLEMQVIEED